MTLQFVELGKGQLDVVERTRPADLGAHVVLQSNGNVQHAVLSSRKSRSAHRKIVVQARGERNAIRAADVKMDLTVGAPIRIQLEHRVAVVDFKHTFEVNHVGKGGKAPPQQRGGDVRASLARTAVLMVAAQNTYESDANERREQR